MAEPQQATAGDGDTTAGGAATKIVEGAGGDGAGASNGATFALPEDQKDKPWAAKITSEADLYSQLDNLTEVVGKKATPPIDYAKATDDEIAEYYAKLAPENGKYEFAEGGDPDFSKGVGEIFSKFGIDARQGKGLAVAVNELAVKIADDQKAVNTDEKQFDQMMKDSFPDNKDKAVAVIQGALKKHAKPDDQKIFDDMDNAARAAVDRTIFKILEAHGAVEGGSQGEGGEGGMDAKADIPAQRKVIIDKIVALKKGAHTQDQVNELTSQINALYTKKK